MRNWVGWMVVGLILLTGSASRQIFAEIVALQNRPIPIIGGGGKSAKKKTVALVRTEFNYVEAMDRAKKAIAEKNYPRAIQFLQGLIEKADGGFYPADANRFVPLQVEANRLLGTLPEEGLSEYRKLYDPKAEGKLANAIERGDLAGVRQVTRRYRHTTVGQKALRTLAEMQLDYGRYAAASVTFRALRDDTPELLALQGVAETMSGRFDVARKTAAKLKKTAPDATAEWGGESVVLSQWLTQFIAKRTKKHSSPVQAGSKTPATMVMSPRWRAPMDPEDPDSLLIPEALTASTGIMGGVGESQLKHGEVSIVSSAPNRSHYYSTRHQSIQGPKVVTKLPAYIVPTLVDDTLVYRDDEAVHAVDRETGEVVWRTGWSLPMARTAEQTNANTGSVYYGGSSSSWALDQGRYRVSTGGGRLFCVYNFVRRQMNPNTGVASDMGASSLAAISIRSQGKLLWSVGHDGLSNSGDTVLAETMYLSVPTYVPVSGEQGRLLVLGIHKQRYVVLCLDAQTGRRIWHTDISQVPESTRSYMLTPFEAIRFAGAKPQLAGDTVVVNTNNGVVAAVDSDTGQPRWAYQYVLNIENRARSGMSGGKQYAQLSPVVIAGDTVVVLPSDHNQVLALSLAEGKKQWEQPRGTTLRIAPIDSQRILILGDKQVTVADRKTGKTLAHRSVVGTPQGRPAQMGGGVYFSTTGYVYRLDLTTYAMQKAGPVSADGLLGNLVADGKSLYAANALGLCRYADLNVAMREIAKKLTDATDPEKIELLQQRSGFRFMAKQYSAALEDLLQARTLADIADEADKKRLLPQLNAKLYRAYVASGNAATGNQADETCQSCFDEAMKLAATNMQKAHMSIRLAKLAVRRKQYAKAVQIAHEIATKYGREVVVDVAIGPSVESNQPLDASKSKLTAQAWAMSKGKFVDTLLKTHGQEHYAVFDGQAKVAFDAAKLTGDPGALQAVETKFPRSKWVTPVRLAAAEIWFSRISQPGKEGKVAHAKCKRLLEDVFNSPKAATPSMRLNAAVGLYYLYTKEGIRFGASDDLRDMMDEIDDKTPVKFGQLVGPLGVVRKQIEAGKVPQPNVAKPEIKVTRGSWPTIRVPLKKLHDITEDAPVMVTDQLGNPAVVDGAVLVWRGKELALIDIAATGEKQIRWKVDAEALAPKPVHNRRMPLYLGMTLVARVVQGGTRIVVAGQDRVVSFDSKTGKMVWTHELEEAGEVRRATMDDRQVVVSGLNQIEVISSETGKLQWAGQGPKMNIRSGVWLRPSILLLPGSVVLQGADRRAIIVYDRSTGKRVGEINGSGPCLTFARAGDDAILVVDGQQANRVCIDKKTHKLHTTEVKLSPLVKRGEDKNRANLYRAIIGSGPGGVIVANNSGGEVSAEWIRFSGSQAHVQNLCLPSQKKGEFTMTAAEAHVWNDRVVIWANRNRQVAAWRYPSNFSNGMWGFGFQANQSKPTWTMQLESPEEPSHVVPSRGLQGETHLIWFQRKYVGQAWTNELMVLDYRTGTVVQRSNLHPGNIAANPSHQVHVQPLCIKEDIVLSLPDGLSVWSQKNEKTPAGKAPAGGK